MYVNRDILIKWHSLTRSLNFLESATSVESEIVRVLITAEVVELVWTLRVFSALADFEVGRWVLLKECFRVDVNESEEMLWRHVRHDVSVVNDSVCNWNSPLEVLHESLVTDSRRAEINEVNSAEMHELGYFKCIDCCKRTTERMAGDNDCRRRVLICKIAHTYIELIRYLIQSLDESVVNFASCAARIWNGDELDVINPVLQVVATTESDDDAIFSSVVSTVSLSFLSFVIDCSYLLHVGMILAAWTAWPRTDFFYITVWCFRVVVHIDSKRCSERAR